jgi:hypothetical protein
MPEDDILHSHCRQNVKSYELVIIRNQNTVYSPDATGVRVSRMTLTMKSVQLPTQHHSDVLPNEVAVLSTREGPQCLMLYTNHFSLQRAGHIYGPVYLTALSCAKGCHVFRENQFAASVTE